MKFIAVAAIAWIFASIPTAQAQSSASQNCCPGTDVNGQATDPCFENYQRALIRGEAFGLLSQVKTLVYEIYLNTGTWPAPGDPRYVSAPTSYAQNWTSRLDLLANGVLSVTLNRQAGGGSIWLRPILTADPNIPAYWKCESPDRPLISQLVPGCAYTGRIL